MPASLSSELLEGYTEQFSGLSAALIAQGIQLYTTSFR